MLLDLDLSISSVRFVSVSYNNLQGAGREGIQSRSGSDWACTAQESRSALRLLR